MVKLNPIEMRAVVLALAALLAVLLVRWHQAESARVELKVISEEVAGVQR